MYVEEELYEKAQIVFGYPTQFVMAMEEASELAVAISHYLRHTTVQAVEEIADGIADMEIMIAQLKFMFQEQDECIVDRVNQIKHEKLQRLAKMLEVEEVL